MGLYDKKNQTLSRDEAVSSLESLLPGSFFEIQLSKALNIRVKAKLIGYAQKRYFIIQFLTRLKDSDVQLLESSNALVIRTIIEKNAGQCIAFESQLLHVINEPHKLHFIKYPEKIEQFALRKEKRLATHLPANIGVFVYEDQQAPLILQGTILDISCHGCRFHVAYSQDKPDITQKILRIVIHFAASDETLLIYSQVANFHWRNENELSLGLEYIDEESKKPHKSHRLEQLLVKLKFIDDPEK